MDKKTIKKLNKIKADTSFIEFVLEESGLKDTTVISQDELFGPIDKKLKMSQWKKIKRRLQKIYGSNWKNKWIEQREIMKGNEKIKYLKSNKFGIMPIIPTGNKPKATLLFNVVFILLEYFRDLTDGQSCWKLIEDFVSPYCKNDIVYSYSDLTSKWQHRKKDYDNLDGKTYYLSIYNFYKKLKLNLKEYEV